MNLYVVMAVKLVAVLTTAVVELIRSMAVKLCCIDTPPPQPPTVETASFIVLRQVTGLAVGISVVTLRACRHDSCFPARAVTG